MYMEIFYSVKKKYLKILNILSYIILKRIIYFDYTPKKKKKRKLKRVFAFSIYWTIVPILCVLTVDMITSFSMSSEMKNLRKFVFMYIISNICYSYNLTNRINKINRIFISELPQRRSLIE